MARQMHELACSLPNGRRPLRYHTGACPAGGEKSVDLATMVLLGLGMAMDAFAVSVSNGLAHRGRPLPCALACGTAFGLAQAAMPLLGFFAGYTFSGYIHRFDHWVALALLALLGGRMVWEALPLLLQRLSTL